MLSVLDKIIGRLKDLEITTLFWAAIIVITIQNEIENPGFIRNGIESWALAYSDIIMYMARAFICVAIYGLVAIFIIKLIRKIVRFF